MNGKFTQNTPTRQAEHAMGTYEESEIRWNTSDHQGMRETMEILARKVESDDLKRFKRARWYRTGVERGATRNVRGSTANDS